MYWTEAVVGRRSVKNVLLEIRKIQGKTPVPEPLFQLTCEFCEIYKNTFIYRTLLVAASETIF